MNSFGSSQKTKMKPVCSGLSKLWVIPWRRSIGSTSGSQSFQLTQLIRLRFPSRRRTNYAQNATCRSFLIVWHLYSSALTSLESFTDSWHVFPSNWSLATLLLPLLLVKQTNIDLSSLFQSPLLLSIEKVALDVPYGMTTVCSLV